MHVYSNSMYVQYTNPKGIFYIPTFEKIRGPSLQASGVDGNYGQALPLIWVNFENLFKIVFQLVSKLRGGGRGAGPMCTGWGF